MGSGHFGPSFCCGQPLAAAAGFCILFCFGRVMMTIFFPRPKTKGRHANECRFLFVSLRFVQHFVVLCVFFWEPVYYWRQCVLHAFEGKEKSLCAANKGRYDTKIMTKNDSSSRENVWWPIAKQHTAHIVSMLIN